jgi:predicted nuclease of predicted toxin-antitoxin system
MRFPIDECLTLDLVSVATRAGYEAQHVAHAGKAGWKDWNVAEYASDGDFIVVTNNASDFRRLYAKQPIHAGLVIIIPNVKRLEQQRLFGLVVEELATLGDPVNRALELDIGGAEIVLSLYDMPTGPQ